MGTPHGGSYLADWGYTVARLLNHLRQANAGTLALLKRKSEVLRAVEEVFQGQISVSGQLSHVKIFCFYETVAVNVVGYVVPEESAVVYPHPNCGIDADHMDMTKFSSQNDPGFINLKGIILDWNQQRSKDPVQEATQELEQRSPAVSMSLNDGTIKSHVFQQGTGNAGGNIYNGSVTR
ncbi:hypothetical protein ACN47E_002330 [Coniothyrium glycines]